MVSFSVCFFFGTNVQDFDGRVRYLGRRGLRISRAGIVASYAYLMSQARKCRRGDTVWAKESREVPGQLDGMHSRESLPAGLGWEEPTGGGSAQVAEVIRASSKCNARSRPSHTGVA